MGEDEGFEGMLIVIRRGSGHRTMTMTLLKSTSFLSQELAVIVIIIGFQMRSFSLYK